MIENIHQSRESITAEQYDLRGSPHLFLSITHTTKDLFKTLCVLNFRIFKPFCSIIMQGFNIFSSPLVLVAFLSLLKLLAELIYMHYTSPEYKESALDLQYLLNLLRTIHQKILAKLIYMHYTSPEYQESALDLQFLLNLLRKLYQKIFKVLANQACSYSDQFLGLKSILLPLNLYG